MINWMPRTVSVHVMQSERHASEKPEKLTKMRTTGTACGSSTHDLKTSIWFKDCSHANTADSPVIKVTV